MPRPTPFLDTLKDPILFCFYARTTLYYDKRNEVTR